MNLLDVKTIFLSYLISNAISATVIFSLWWQNRRRFPGLDFWLADFVMQFIAMCLVILRGRVPDFVSMTVSNSLIMGGTILLYVGLERFVGRRSAQTHNIVLLAVFIPVHLYFVMVQPNLDARTILLNLGVLVLCSQCAWLLLRRVDLETRPISQSVGMVFAVYGLVSVARIIVNLAFPSDNNFFNFNPLDGLLILTDQMLFIILTFNLFLMVNRRLVNDLEDDIHERKRVERELRLSEEKFFKAFHSSPDAIIISRVSDGNIVDVNDGFSRISEYSRVEALASSTIRLGLWANPQDREACLAVLLENNRVHDYEYDFCTKSGKIIKGLYSGEIIQLNHEAYVLSVVRDITERKRMEAALRESETVFSSFLENSPIYVFFKDKNIRALHLSKNYEQMLGMPVSEAIGKTMDELFPSDLAKSMVADDLRILNEGQRVDIVEELNSRIYETTKFPIYKDGKPDMLAGFTLDITERRQAEDELRKLSRAIEQSPASIVITDTKGNIEYVNPRFSQVTGYSLDEAIGKNPRILKTDKTPKKTHEELWKTITMGKEWHGEFVNRKKNGGLYYESAIISPIIDARGMTTNYLAVKEDITERKKSEEEIRLLQAELHEQAIRDPLTGLYNRRYLNETLERELARAARERYSVSFVMIDIDHFKRINDTFGHKAGDAVLQKLATQLLSKTRAGDIICRYGGEEFLAVLPNVTAEEAFQISERWRGLFLGSTLLLKYRDAKATISCGISEFPVHGNTGNELIELADKAMYQAKAKGRNQVLIWRTEHVE